MREIVIKLYEEEYEEIINDEACGLHPLTRAVAHGKVLPKGHTELIDTRILIQDFCMASSAMKANGVAPVFDLHEITNLILAQDVLVDIDKEV